MSQIKELKDALAQFEEYIKNLQFKMNIDNILKKCKREIILT